MPHRPLAALALASLLIPAGHAATPASPKPAPPWQGKLSPCTLPEGGGKAFCGTHEVFENREARSGRVRTERTPSALATPPERS